MPSAIPVIGKKFGRWTVLRFAGATTGHRKYWCRCECGTEREVYLETMRRGSAVPSCGCYKREALSARTMKHGHAKMESPEYGSWHSMWSRARATQGRMFESYAGRGITVCERWQSFENFLADMGPRPRGKTLDRINNDGNYEPGNCRWATPVQQGHNTRIPKNNTSGFTGVSFEKRRGHWVALVKYKGRNHYLGSFCDPVTASDARKQFLDDQINAF